MRPRYAGVLGALLIVGLAACNPQEPPVDPQSADKPTATAEGLTPDAKASIAAKLGYPPDPDAAQRAALIKALNAIDLDLAHGKEDKAVSRAMDTCRSLKDYPDDFAKQTDVAAKRWTSPTHPEGRTPAVAAETVKAARTTICPNF